MSAGAEKLTWKWLKGAQTDSSDFGDPANASTAYSLCVYADTTLIMEMQVPPQGTCDGHPCWKQTAHGFKYKDRTLSNDGARVLFLKSGAQGSAKVVVKGAGGALPLPPIPPSGLTLPVRVQLQNNTPDCWSAIFSGPQINGPDVFKAKQ